MIQYLNSTPRVYAASKESHRYSALMSVALISTILSCGVSLRAAEVSACGWHYETIKAEARSLPCTRNVALNAYPSYQEAHLKQKIQAALIMSALLPESLRALDEISVSSILLRDLPQARCALERREELAPDAYATHANWGTYFTFSGELDRAEQHVQATLDADPQAHFGREKDHLLLIQYLRERQPKGDFKVDLYGRELKKQLKTIYPVKRESKQVLREQEAALVSMISIYGASESPLLFATLGVTLKQQGNLLLAASALRRAIKLRHPERRLFKRWIKRAHRHYLRKYEKKPNARRGAFADLETSILRAENAASYRVKKYHKWLTKRFKEGVRFWDRSGLEELYQEQIRRKLRCKLPSAQPLVHQMPQYPSHERALNERIASLKSLLSELESAAQLKEKCAVLQSALAQRVDVSSEITGSQATEVNKVNRVNTSEGSPPDSLSPEEILNRIIETGLQCTKLKVRPRGLKCLNP